MNAVLSYLPPLSSEARSSRPAAEGARRRTIDDTLERRASSGDRRALEALLREHARAIHEVCRYVAGYHDAHDATQESLERIVTQIARFDPEKGTFRAWALTLTRNVCRDRLRRRGLERRTFHDDGEEVASVARDERTDVESTALARIDSARVLAALDTLPEQMRLAVVLFHGHDASYEEIASTLDVPIGTVMTWLHRGRKRLREAVEKPRPEVPAQARGGGAR